MPKPRLKYGEVFAVKSPYAHNSVADLCRRYEVAVKKRGRELSADQVSRIGIIQRSSLGQKDAAKLTLADYTTFADERRQNKVATFMHRNNGSPLKELKPATVRHDFTNITVVLTWAHDYEDVDVNLKLLKKAMRRLKDEGVLGKSEPRERRPLIEELAARRDYFLEHSKAFMVLMDEWQIASCRRLGESCALLWKDWDAETHTILVRKMKDPKKKNKQKVVALTPEAEAIMVRLAYERGPDDAEPRIFPFNKRTVSNYSTEANKALGIQNLRLHDSRRDGASRLMEQGHPSKLVSLVTGHENTAILDRVYGKPDPRLFGKQLAQQSAS